MSSKTRRPESPAEYMRFKSGLWEKLRQASDLLEDIKQDMAVMADAVTDYEEAIKALPNSLLPVVDATACANARRVLKKWKRRFKQHG